MTHLFENAPERIALLRYALDNAGYSTASVRELLGEHFLEFLARNEVPALLRRTDSDSPLEALVRLFLAGARVEQHVAERAIAPLSLVDAEGAGLLSSDGTWVTGLVRLRPYDVEGRQFVVASDAPTAWVGGTSNEPAASDHVMGVGGGSVLLAKLTIRDPVARALDLGTGGGVQAMHASLHAGEVVATDVNSRALSFARFSLQLSGVPNVSTREGNLFSSVLGERFGLIVSNPPYVISPESRLAYRDSGLEGDEICEHIVRQAPTYMEEGGWCQLLANWGQRQGDSWTSRLGDWFEGTGCDAWVIQRSSEDVEEYATAWVLHDASANPDAYSQAKVLDDWMDYYSGLDIDRIGFGLITLRRRLSGRPFIRFEELRHDPGGPVGDDLRRSFELVDWLESLGGDDGLLEARLVVSPDVHLHRDLVVTDRRFETKTAKLWRSTGLGREGLVDDHAAAVVAHCDGTSSLRSLLAELAAHLGAGTDAVTSAALPAVRMLVEQGFLLPADAGG